MSSPEINGHQPNKPNRNRIKQFTDAFKGCLKNFMNDPNDYMGISNRGWRPEQPTPLCVVPAIELELATEKVLPMPSANANTIATPVTSIPVDAVTTTIAAAHAL